MKSWFRGIGSVAGIGATMVALTVLAAEKSGKPEARAPKDAKAKKVVISNGGSDTMVNLAQMWAEAYRQVSADVSVEVSGGGSGVGIRDLMQGMTQIANCSREIEGTERDLIRKKTGKDAFETVVGYDAIAIYVHKDNPAESISMEQLAAIFSAEGTVERWSQIGVSVPGQYDRIIRVSRQNSSGTYLYFRDRVLRKKDFKLGSCDMSGSKDVVELVARTRGAIGYSGMGYATTHVKMLRIRPAKSTEDIAPTVENVQNRKYPLARALYMYTLDKPEGHLGSYIEWILTPAGQQVVRMAGYVPVAGVSHP
jgi:phosphate transport system substrate-binding protein